MNRLLSLTGLLGAALLLGACQDNSGEIEKLRGKVAAQERRIDDAERDWAKERADLAARIDALRDELGTLDVDTEDGRRVSLTEQLASLETRVAELKDAPVGDEKLAAKIDALEKSLDGIREEAVEAARVEAAKTGGADADEVARRLAEEQAANAPTKDLKKALDRLDISEAEKDMIRQHIYDAKQATLETLEIPSADGRIFAEELVDMFIGIQNGDAKQSDFTKLYLELTQTEIPGDIEGRTYAEAIEDIKARNREDISRILTEEDRKKLDAAHEDWSDFDIDDDPFGELYMERLRKREQENSNDE